MICMNQMTEANLHASESVNLLAGSLPLPSWQEKTWSPMWPNSYPSSTGTLSSQIARNYLAKTAQRSLKFNCLVYAQLLPITASLYVTQQYIPLRNSAVVLFACQLITWKAS